MSIQEIEPFSFASSKQLLFGDVLVGSLLRLREECMDDSGAIHWKVQGGSHASGHPELALEVSGTVRLICQRCLKAFDFDLESSSVLVIARNEQNADEIDAMLRDDDVDVVVGVGVMSIMELVEDEALLCIPQAPKHVECSPQQPASVFEDAPLALSPFAFLKKDRH